MFFANKTWNIITIYRKNKVKIHSVAGSDSDFSEYTAKERLVRTEYCGFKRLRFESRFIVDEIL